MITRNCNNCQQEYEAEQRYLDRGQGRFCSRKCSTENRIKNMPALDLNATCSYCGISFHKSLSKISLSKSGHVFCSREHKDLAQRLGGITDIMPAHFGTAKIPDYREIAKRAYPMKCSHCGWDKYPEVLEVNHIDCNRLNNDVSNLEFLCPTCHQVFHFTTKTGKWRSHTI